MQPNSTSPNPTPPSARGTASEPVSGDHDTINAESPSCICYPTSPSLTRRYHLDRRIEDGQPEFKLKPFSTSLTEYCEALPSGWQRHVHPEGLPYFSLPLPTNCPTRVFTEEWMYDPEVFDLIQSAIQDIQDKISQSSHYPATISSDNDLYLELSRDDDGKQLPKKGGKTQCGYYLVNHSRRCIYWVDKVTLNYGLSVILQNVRGDISGHRAKICLEAEYWMNWNNFPALQNKNPDTYHYAVETILDLMTDLVSSDVSAFSFTYEELQKRLEIVQAAKEYKYSTWHIGRFMFEITSERLRHFYGAWCARLSMKQTVFEVTEPEEHLKLLNIISPLFFFIPHAQLRRVRMMTTDQKSTPWLRWHKLFDQLLDEWANTMLIAPIILAANYAFLAIPRFQSSEFPDTHSSPEEIASYLSLATSLSGLILGTMMHRRHKALKDLKDAKIAVILSAFRNEFNLAAGGMHLLFAWSLPQALVTWSVVFFSIAFLLLCFLGTLTVTRVIIGVTAGFLGFCFFYCAAAPGGRGFPQIWFNGVVEAFSGKKSRMKESERASRA